MSFLPECSTFPTIPLLPFPPWRSLPLPAWHSAWCPASVGVSSKASPRCIRRPSFPPVPPPNRVHHPLGPTALPTATPPPAGPSSSRAHRPSKGDPETARFRPPKEENLFHPGVCSATNHRVSPFLPVERRIRLCAVGLWSTGHRPPLCSAVTLVPVSRV